MQDTYIGVQQVLSQGTDSFLCDDKGTRLVSHAEREKRNIKGVIER